MFTGLIEAVGEVVDRKRRAAAPAAIESPLAAELALGDSVAVNGVCLTVTCAPGAEFHADVGPETLRVTTLGRVAAGARVNLERPLRADGRFGGHFVQGHVDGIGHIEELARRGRFSLAHGEFSAGSRALSRAQGIDRDRRHQPDGGAAGRRSLGHA